MWSFAKNTFGNVAITSALMLPLMLGFVGGGVDFVRWHNERTSLKELADTLSTRGAREFLLANATEAQVKAVINNVLDTGYGESYGFAHITPAVSVDTLNATVSVRLVTPPMDGLILTNFMPFMAQHNIQSTAVARGGMNVCVVGLDPNSDGTIALTDSAALDAKSCSILSNSLSAKGVSALKTSVIRAGLTCSAGGVQGAAASFEPAPVLDCPLYEDPLASRESPDVGTCDYIDYQVGTKSGGQSKKEEVTIFPGVYCGGLKILQKAIVTFEPGVYVIKDGPLEVGKESALMGTNVGFYLTGDNAVFWFEKDSSISLTAPKHGSMSGIMFFEDRHAPIGRIHKIDSDDAREFLGTFYLSRGILQVDTQKPVADNSAYTAIVARRLTLAGKATITLNANYNDTDIPVPTGIGPVASTVSLRE